MNRPTANPDKVMTAGVRQAEFVIVSFKPVLPESQLEIFEEDLYPYSESFFDEAEKGAVRGLVYHASVFTGHGRPWEKAAMAYYKRQAQEIDYNFRQDRLIRLGDTAIGEVRSAA